MKTGSTAFQELMVKNSELLHERGIRFRGIRRSELDQLDALMDEEQAKGWPAVLMLSHECLCRVASERLKQAFSRAPAQPKAVLVARRLREIYPSLYLQNLKGHVMRTSSYREFLEEQSARDQSPELATRGQVFRYRFLEQQLAAAGCQVSWVRYCRDHLIQDLLSWTGEQGCLPLGPDDLVPLPPPRGISPRRSLDGAVVDVARLLNRQCRNGTITASVREQLLSALLDSSDQIRTERQGPDCFRSTHDGELDALDDELNGDFWRETFPSQQS